MTLGKPGVAGDGQDTFNAPSDVLVAPNGDIFVADGHGGNTNAPHREVHQGRQVHQGLGHARAPAPGEFDTPHRLAMDSPGRLFVGRPREQPHPDLRSGRQVPRPSGSSSAGRAASTSTRTTCIYVADSQSTEKTNPGFEQGIRIGSAKDGKVTAYIPETKELGALEGVAADDAGNRLCRLHQHDEPAPLRADRHGRQEVAADCWWTRATRPLPHGERASAFAVRGRYNADPVLIRRKRS